MTDHGIADITEAAREDGRAQRSQVARRIALALVLAVLAGGLAVAFVLQFDTRSVAVGATKCGRGDQTACRQSVDNLARSCKLTSIKRDRDPAAALERCKGLRTSLANLPDSLR